MRLLKRVKRLERSEVRVLLSALWALITVRTALHLFPFERVRIWAATTRESSRAMSSRQLSWGIATAAKIVPGATCLTQALALQKLLARSDRASCLHVGVSRRNGEFSAHAWLVEDGEILIGESEAGIHKTLGRWNSENLQDS